MKRPLFAQISGAITLLALSMHTASIALLFQPNEKPQLRRIGLHTMAALSFLALLIAAPACFYASRNKGQRIQADERHSKIYTTVFSLGWSAFALGLGADATAYLNQVFRWICEDDSHTNDSDMCKLNQIMFPSAAASFTIGIALLALSITLFNQGKHIKARSCSTNMLRAPNGSIPFSYQPPQLTQTTTSPSSPISINSSPVTSRTIPQKQPCHLRDAPVTRSPAQTSLSGETHMRSI